MLRNTGIYMIIDNRLPAYVGKVAKYKYCANTIGENRSVLFNKRYKNRRIIQKATGTELKIKNAARIFAIEGEYDYLLRINVATGS